MPPVYATPYMATEPVMKVNAISPITIPFDYQGLDASSTMQSSDGGDYYKNRVSMRLRYNRLSVATWAHRMKNRRFHLLLRDWNGQRWLYLNLKFSGRLTQESLLSSSNEWEFVFEGDSLDTPISLPAAGPVLAPGEIPDFTGTTLLGVSLSTFEDDVAAKASGLTVGQYYVLAAANPYGLPAGVIKRITEI
jgi:hypothetical protein